MFVTTPSARSTRRLSYGEVLSSWVSSSPRTILKGVGYNPYRRLPARPGDYVMVGAVLVIALVLLAWGVFG